MKIDEIKINGFGKLKNKEINLSDGINIICGENEAGKSTILKFIETMFYGASKNKNGKDISDFDKYKPWDDSEFSGKIKYSLDNGQNYEIFREFKKKNPIIYHENEDVSKEFSIDKSKGINFLEQQIGIDENSFMNTAIVSQREVELEQADTTQIVQKISNLVSSGDDSISFKKSMEKLTKFQNENIGTDRTKGKPMNVVDNNIQKLLLEKKKLSEFVESKQINSSEKEKIQSRLTELKAQKKELREQKIQSEDAKVEIAKKNTNIYTYLLILFVFLCVIVFGFVRNIIADLLSIIPVVICFILMKKKSNKELESLKKTNQDLAKKFEEKDENIQNEIDDFNFKLHIFDTESAELEKNLSELAKIEEKLEEQLEIKEELTSLNKSFELAKECMEKAYDEIKHNISPKFEQKLNEITSEITDEKYKNVTVNDETGLIIEVENGAYFPVQRLSTGTIDEMYLALRMSLLSEISNEKLPMIFDETFAYFDDTRLKNVLCYLQDKNYDNQIIILTCSDREERALKELKIEYNVIPLEK